MNISLTLVYQCVQVAALVCIALWFFQAKNRGLGGIFRGLAMFTSILAPILLYLERQEKISLLVWIYLGISAFTFLIFAVDKAIAMSGGDGTRVPENVLLILSVFGILGGISAMLVFHHKNKKAKLQYLMPVIALVELVLFYFLRLRDTKLSMIDWKSLGIFPIMTLVSSFVVCLLLIRTFILVRLLVIIPISLAAALVSVDFFFHLDSALSPMEMIKAKPIPFCAIALVVFLILELISVKTKFITSGNEVRKKTDHSGKNG